MNNDSLLDLPIWVYPKEDCALKEDVISSCAACPVVAEVLISRGFNDPEAIYDFLYPKLSQLHDPYLFVDMEKATDRILLALHKKERILICGDNDADGITGTALLTEFLESLGLIVYYYVPHSTSIELNLMHEALLCGIRNNCTLLITVDCGVTSAVAIEEAGRNGIDVIVTDHHEPTDRIPDCIAILNPKLVHSTYPNRDITGVGVAFKLAHAVANRLAGEDCLHSDSNELKKYLDLVALGTIADRASLLGENRILVRYGLLELRQTKRIGLIRLCNLSQVQLAQITSAEIAEQIVPRLNSLGRLADPWKGVQILVCQEGATAENLAKYLEESNDKRRKIERQNMKELEHYISKNSSLVKQKALVLHSCSWHPGMVSIVAARLVRRYNRPTFIIAIKEGIGKGSLRTISEFPLLSLLKQKAHLFLSFGGHDYAAGVLLKEENIAEFTEFFIQTANHSLKETDIRGKIQLDAKVAFHQVTFEFMEALQLLEPFGNGNPPPIFYGKAQQIWPPKRVGSSHLKMFFEQNDRRLEGIGFRMAHRRHSLLKNNLSLHIAFTPFLNISLQNPSIQLQIRDFYEIPK